MSRRCAGIRDGEYRALQVLHSAPFLGCHTGVYIRVHHYVLAERQSAAVMETECLPRRVTVSADHLYIHMWGTGAEFGGGAGGAPARSKYIIIGKGFDTNEPQVSRFIERRDDLLLAGTGVSFSDACDGEEGTLNESLLS